MIERLTDKSSPKIYQQIEDIFYETGNLDFKSESDRKKFKKKYLDDYREQEFFYYRKDKVLGYVCATKSTLDDKNLLTKFPYYACLAPVFVQAFSAHLHINLTAAARGQGIGSELITCMLRHLRQSQVQGVHVITTSDAQNVSFYQRNGFKEQLLLGTPFSHLMALGRHLH